MLAELWRITSFRLTVLYGALFVLAVIGLLALIYTETAHFQNQQVDQILLGESHVFSNATREQVRTDIAYEIARDIRHINFFGLFASDGTVLAGNVGHVPGELQLDAKPRALSAAAITDLFPHALEVRAIARRLPNGDMFIVARDVAELEQIRQALLRGCFLIATVILLLGILGGVFYSLPAVRHIRQIDTAARRIAAGDYTQRLPPGKRNQELDTLARIVNSMLDETERLMGEIKSCSDNIAHDLRTPLNRLRASIYRTQQSVDIPSSAHAMLEHALTQTDLLLGRFRAISRISEIESKRRHAGFSRASLSSVLHKINDLYEPLAVQENIKLTLHTGEDVTIDCDPELLFEAIGNLVDNAIKFTPPAGSVIVELAKTAQGPEISVSDTGPGIAIAQRKLVLQRFYRIAESRNVEGSGLGLSLVDAIVRLHDFKLTIDESEIGGTHLCIQCWPHTNFLS